MRQFLRIENPLKMIKNDFYIMLKALLPTYMLSTTSKSKGNQAMKFDKLIEYSVKKNHADNEVGTLVSDLFIFSIKVFIKGKSKWSAP